MEHQSDYCVIDRRFYANEYLPSDGTLCAEGISSFYYSTLFSLVSAGRSMDYKEWLKQWEYFF
jgi:hypothetical protein